MSSVTKRISEVKQPRGGYIKPSQFDIKILDDREMLFEEENLHASIYRIDCRLFDKIVYGC